MRVLELYAGLGGIAAALAGAVHRGDVEIAAALDVDRRGLAVYSANFPHPTVPRTLDRIDPGDLAACGADLWTLSPPCQPYTRRGAGRDVDDPRAASLMAVLAAVARVEPAYLFLENVPGFAASRAHALLITTLTAAGYAWREIQLCPSELGWPNRRRRFYLAAAHRDAEPLRPAVAPPASRRPLAAFVDAAFDDHPDLAVEADLARRYAGALDVVDAADPQAVTACFTSAYGRSPVRSGSYLALEPVAIGVAERRLRRFHPREILALLGFPATYRLPPGLSTRKAWRLAGNSLSLPAVRRVLAAIPGLEHVEDLPQG